MHTEGRFAPETADRARERYAAVGTTAQVVVRQVARAMSFDREEYDERVTPDVVETARDVVFAGDLRIHVGTREEFEDWRDGRDYEVERIGSENVDGVAWHAAPFADLAVAATFSEEPDAAVETVRRQAMGRIYEDVV
ncbi:MAG: DUF5809 family protein [Haloarculaceae archaeon]